MKRNQLARRLLLGFSTLLLVIAFTNLSFAQDQETPQQVMKFSYLQVKSGMELEFEEFVKNKIPFFQKMGLTTMDIFKTSNFGKSGKYLIITPLQDPAALDAELSAPQSNVPIELVSVLSSVNRMVESGHDFVLTPQPDLNMPPAEDYVFKLIVNITIGVKAGREADFEKGAKKAVQAMGKTNIKGILLGKVGLGGNLGEYIMFNLYDSFKEMTANEPAIQKELAALDLTSLTGAVNYRQSEVLVRIPELCIEPE